MPPYILNIELLKNDYVCTNKITKFAHSIQSFSNFPNPYFLSLQVYIHMLQSHCTLEKQYGGTNGNVINPAN